MLRPFLVFLTMAFLLAMQTASAWTGDEDEDEPQDSCGLDVHPQDPCEQGMVDVCLLLGFRYSGGNSPDHQRANVYFRHACDGREMQGCFALGIAHHQGRGTTVDLMAAAALYHQACAGGLGAACTNLGNLYSDGLGGTRDHPRAATHYEQGCEFQDMMGCTNLGNLYVRGEGVPQDYDEAGALFERACEEGYADACISLGAMCARGMGRPVDMASARLYIRKGSRLHRKNCRKGDSRACRELAKIHGP